MRRRRSLAGLGRRRSSVRRPARRRRHTGGAWYDTLWSGIKSAANWVKDKGLISKGLALVPGLAGKVGSVAAASLGLGRRRRRTVTRRRTRRRGGDNGKPQIINGKPAGNSSPDSTMRKQGRLSSLRSYLQKNKYISRALRFGSKFHPPLGDLASVAEKHGYGRRRRVGRPKKASIRRGRGGSFLSNLGASLSNPNSRLAKFGRFGLGRRRARGGLNGNYFSTSQIAAPLY